MKVEKDVTNAGGEWPLQTRANFSRLQRDNFEGLNCYYSFHWDRVNAANNPTLWLGLYRKLLYESFISIRIQTTRIGESSQLISAGQMELSVLHKRHTNHLQIWIIWEAIQILRTLLFRSGVFFQESKALSMKDRKLS